MAHVFISYKRGTKDEDFALQLKTKLEEAGIEAKIDKEFLLPGENWREAIDAAIQSAFALAAVMSPNARMSEYVTYEWAFALGVGVKVIPILLEQTELHPRLDVLQYLDFTNHWSLPWDKLIHRLQKLKQEYKPRSKSISEISPLKELLADLNSSNRDKRRNAARLLGNSGDTAALPDLLNTLYQDESWIVRAEAAFALGQLKDENSVTPLIRALYNDKSVNVRAAAALALGEIGVVAAVDALIDVMESSRYSTEAKLQKAIITAVGKLGDSSVVPKLIKSTPYRDSVVLAEIAKVLGKFGDARGIPFLIKLLNDNNHIWKVNQLITIASIAAEALERIGTPEALAAVEEWRRQQGNAQE